jgi:hypothetical protein
VPVSNHLHLWLVRHSLQIRVGKTIDAKRSILHPDLKTVPHQPQVQVIGNGHVDFLLLWDVILVECPVVRMS